MINIEEFNFILTVNIAIGVIIGLTIYSISSSLISKYAEKNFISLVRWVAIKFSNLKFQADWISPALGRPDIKIKRNHIAFTAHPIGAGTDLIIKITPKGRKYIPKKLFVDSTYRIQVIDPKNELQLSQCERNSEAHNYYEFGRVKMNFFEPIVIKAGVQFKQNFSNYKIFVRIHFDNKFYITELSFSVTTIPNG